VAAPLNYTPGPRSRRTRDRILATAREAFALNGFDRTSTKAIAQVAGVNSALIFRYFGTKSGLYEAAVMQPLEAVINDFVERWRHYGKHPHPATLAASDFVGGFYDLFHQHRGLVQAMVRSGDGTGSTHPRAFELSTTLNGLLHEVDNVVEVEANKRGWAGFDTTMTTRITLGVAFSVAVLEDWLFPADPDRPSRDELVAGMTSYVLRSISNPNGPNGFSDD
jgi:AcrR family transcriptional regulator